MKIWLDDDLDDPDMPNRQTPPGWVGVKTAQEAIELLATESVSEIDLDHDLGDENEVGNGYQVLLYIEEKVLLEGVRPPIMRVHTANPSARQKMLAAIERILQRVA